MKNRKCLLMIPLLAAPFAVAGQQSMSLPGDESQELSERNLQVLIAECEACHGPGGVSDRDEVPTLAGMAAGDILASIEQFYFYERHCPDAQPVGDKPASGASNMCDIASSLTRQETLALGRFFEGAGTRSPQ